VAIRIPNLQKIADSLIIGQYLYQDLHLDYEPGGVFNTFSELNVPNNDIRVDYNELAIKNSLRNLFNTLPGQRFLFPRFGLDLTKYLFQSISEDNGTRIAEDIITSIEKYERRVKVNRCNVVAFPDANKYEIDIIVEIPSLNTNFPIYTDFDIKKQSFIILQTSRNR
jgi:phage baseplate assembly protein W